MRIGLGSLVGANPFGIRSTLVSDLVMIALLSAATLTVLGYIHACARLTASEKNPMDRKP